MGGKLQTVLGVRAMVGLIFFEVCGGPYGTEAVVRHAGALLSIIGFLLMPLVWSMPIAVMTAELCSDDPHVGGKIHFVHKEWGPHVGWYNGWVNAISNVFDVATLPAMALSYVSDFVGPVGSLSHWAAAFGLVCIAVVLNILGVEIVGNSSYVLCIGVCIPPLLMAFMGLPELTLPPAPAVRAVDWVKFLTCLMWNTSGFDDAGATAAEVTGPADVYPRALTIAIVLVTALYVAPLAVGTSILPDISLWHDGYLSTVAAAIGGSGLAVALSGAGFLSSVAQLIALLCSSVREIVCMAEQTNQPVPSVFGHLHASRGTPHVCTVAFGFALVFVLQYDFVELIAATVLFDCISFLIQFATWIRFRWRTRDLVVEPGIFRTSLSFRFVVIWSLAPASLCIAVICLKALQDGLALLLTLVVGEMLYQLQFLCPQRRNEALEAPLTTK